MIHTSRHYVWLALLLSTTAIAAWAQDSAPKAAPRAAEPASPIGGDSGSAETPDAASSNVPPLSGVDIRSPMARLFSRHNRLTPHFRVYESLDNGAYFGQTGSLQSVT